MHLGERCVLFALAEDTKGTVFPVDVGPRHIVASIILWMREYLRPPNARMREQGNDGVLAESRALLTCVP
jgi:hypothetical protein